MGYHWYVLEIATLFFVMGISSGIAMNYSPNRITDLFIAGVKDILSAALVVGLAGGIIIVLQNGKVIDPMLHGIADSMKDVGRYGSLSIMYGIQTLINLAMTSGSAKAALTMPIMAPFSDLINVSTAGNNHGLPVWRWIYKYDNPYLSGPRRCTWRRENSL